MVGCFALLEDLYTHNLIKSVGCGGWVDYSSKLCGRSTTLRGCMMPMCQWGHLGTHTQV